jgi:radical SAM superfamily enzyme YgiQ (UPF0313 family)
VAFYDDALLHKPAEALVPFLEEVLRRGWQVRFHTPNGLHARLVTPELARLMVRAGFETFYLGFESTSANWQRGTGGKVFTEDLTRAVNDLLEAGADPDRITAYIMLGHPRGDAETVEDSMRAVHSLGIRIMLAEFSPIPGTVDGEAAGAMVDMTEPLYHNKTAFAIEVHGHEDVNRLKDLCRQWNRSRVR